MITAADTNILADIVFPTSAFKAASRAALESAADAGTVVVSEPVIAELAAYFDDEAGLFRFLAEVGVQLLPSSIQTLIYAGKIWRQYISRRSRLLACPRCGATHELNCRECGAVIAPRQHIVADFIIGAHASLQADLLLTRDRGYYRTYFADLTLG